MKENLYDTLLIINLIKCHVCVPPPFLHVIFLQNVARYIFALKLDFIMNIITSGSHKPAFKKKTTPRQ